MNVIKHGKEYDNSAYSICECNHCGCCFEYSETEINTYPNEEEYVICPECHKDLKINFYEPSKS